MGVFSSKRIVSVSARTMNLVEVSKNPFNEVILGAVIKEEGITSSLMTAMHGGVAVNIPQILSYARDTYTLGLPQGKALTYNVIDLDRIDEILLLTFGGNPQLKAVGATYVNVTPLIAAYPHLYNNRQYDRATNTISAYPPGLVWTQEVGPGSLNVATANKRVTVKSVSVAGDGVSLDIVYALFLERPVVKYAGEEMYLENQYIQESYGYTENVSCPWAPDVTWGEEFVLAFYKEYENSLPIGSDIPWLYQVSSEVYPDLGSANVVSDTPDYFPVIPIRYNNQDLMSDTYKDTDLYKTSHKLAKLAKVDLDLLASKLNENPNVGSIDHAYVMYGINIRTEVPDCLKYLHKFFDNLYETQYSNELDHINNVGHTPYYGLFGGVNSYNTNAANDSSFGEYGLQIYLDYDYVKSTVTPGQAGDGKIGTITKEFTEYSENVITGSDEGGPIYELITKGAMILKLQIAENVIHTVGVYGLEHRNSIYEGHYEYTSMLDVIRDPDENNLVIPLQFQLTQSFGLNSRGNIYNDAMILVINTYDVVKGKWYTAGWFKIIMVIVAVIVIVLTIIYAPWALWEELTGWALFFAVLQYVAIQVLVSITISLAAKYIVKEFGAKLGIIGTIILLAVAVVFSRGAGLAGAAKEFMMVTAQVCLQASAALISATNEFLIEAGDKIRNEYLDFESKLEDRYEELKTAEDLLDMNADINPLTFARPPRLKIVPNETPDQFYSRCLGLTTYTMFTIHEQIPDFCTTHLKLPRSISTDLYQRV